MIFEDEQIALIQARMLSGQHITYTDTKTKQKEYVIAKEDLEDITVEQYKRLTATLEYNEIKDYYESRYSIHANGIKLHLLDMFIPYNTELTQEELSIFSKECNLTVNELLYTLND